jgi:hypothetical protein
MAFFCEAIIVKIKTNEYPPAAHKQFWDIPSLALRAGFSVRHFRRIIEEDRIPVLRIGRKFFILTSDFEKWKSLNIRGITDFGRRVA